jgi:hypothetical protein
MMLTAVLLSISLGGMQVSAQPTARLDDFSKIQVIRQHLDTLELSVRQAKQKADDDPQGLAALEKQYEDVVTAFDTWRAAATSASGGSPQASGKQVEELARAAVLAMANFGRDARAFSSGRPAALDARAVSRFEDRLIEAGRALARLDEEVRLKAADTLFCRPWSEVRS